MIIPVGLIIFLGNYLVWLELAFVFVCLYRISIKPFRDFSALFVALIAGFVIARIAGLFYSHLQPFVKTGLDPIIYHTPDNSFPSDHAVLAFVLATALFVKNKRLGTAAYIFAIGVLFGRVLGGIHYPIDVTVGAIIGIIAMFFSLKIFNLIRGYSEMGEN